jgi:hypothetical protein
MKSSIDIGIINLGDVNKSREISHRLFTGNGSLYIVSSVRRNQNNHQAPNPVGFLCECHVQSYKRLQEPPKVEHYTFQNIPLLCTVQCNSLDTIELLLTSTQLFVNGLLQNRFEFHCTPKEFNCDLNVQAYKGFLP